MDGGYGYCNALEAISLAIKSQWTTGGNRIRHIIVVLSNSLARQLGGNQRLLSAYPSNVPKTFEGLNRWWDGTDFTFDGSFQSRSLRLIGFISPQEPLWRDTMCSWYRFWPAYSQRDGTDLEEVDHRSVVDMIFGDF